MTVRPASPIRLLHAFPTFQVGGQQARFIQLANQFGPAFHHTIVAMDNQFDAGDRLGPQVSWEPLRLDVLKGGLTVNRKAFREVLRRLRPDLVLSYNWGAIEWAVANFPRLSPHVHVEGGFGPEEALRQLPRRVWARHVVLGWTGVPVVVVSRQLVDLALRQWHLPRKGVWFIPNGVEPPPSRPDNLVPDGDYTPCIGTVAGLRPEKNVARLVRAFAALRKYHRARLVIVGGGPLLDDLRALADQLGVAAEVEFTGYLADPARRLREFDLYALPSDTEQSPNAMLEAMAMGMPVVATRVGDVPSVLANVSPENLCEPDDAAFAAALQRVFCQPAAWADWGARGRAEVLRHYSRQAMFDAWHSVWRNLAPAPQGLTTA